MRPGAVTGTPLYPQIPYKLCSLYLQPQYTVTEKTFPAVQSSRGFSAAYWLYSPAFRTRAQPQWFEFNAFATEAGTPGKLRGTRRPARMLAIPISLELCLVHCPRYPACHTRPQPLRFKYNAFRI